VGHGKEPSCGLSRRIQEDLMNKVDVCFILATGIGLFLLCATIMIYVRTGPKKGSCGCGRKKSRGIKPL
jgi:glutaredoxin-related protein